MNINKCIGIAVDFPSYKKRKLFAEDDNMVVMDHEYEVEE